MIRSLYSGVSGLTNHQTKMDVIGNNIANVNSYGFKASKAIFKDIFYQTTIGQTSGSASIAGNNPATVGYGVQIADITKDMSMSSLQSTNRTLDLAISGEGFFVTATFPFSAGEPAVNIPTAAAQYDAGKATADDYSSCSQVLYTRMGNMGVDSYGNLVAGSNTFLLGTRNNALGLSQISDESSDTLMNEELKDVNGDNKVDAADLTFENTININKLIQEAYNIHTDESGFLYTYTSVVPTQDATTKEWTVAYSTPVYCDKSGEPITDSSGATIPWAATADAAAIKAAIDKGAIQGEFTFKDLGAFNIGKTGVITTTYNNVMKAIARIEVAVFDNQEGLIEAGNTSYSETAASGSPSIKAPGSEGAGQVISNKLEMSNVNLANEFSDMIVTQRGFQANSRIITVSDTMLEELVNLKR